MIVNFDFCFSPYDYCQSCYNDLVGAAFFARFPRATIKQPLVSMDTAWKMRNFSNTVNFLEYNFATLSCAICGVDTELPGQ